MVFRSKKNLMLFLGQLNYIGHGQCGHCFLEPSTNRVYKVNSEVFKDFFWVGYSSDIDLVVERFSGLDNKTFLFAEDILYIGNMPVGYVSLYLPGNNLYKINPLRVNLDKFEENIKIAHEDIKDISNKGVIIYDIVYNIMYGKSFFVKDFGEFGLREDFSPLQENLEMFDLELFWFLVDNYFDDFVKQNRQLRELYRDKEDILLFLKLFRKYLSEHIGKKITRLGEAKYCVDKNPSAVGIDYKRDYYPLKKLKR